MKLPVDQRLDGEAWIVSIETVPVATRASTERQLGALVRGAIVFLRSVFRGADAVDIPDNLRPDAGLPPREPERMPEPWDKTPLW